MTLAGKAAIVQELKPIVEAIGDNHLARTLFVSHFGQKLGLTAEQMLKGMPTSPPPQASIREAPKKKPGKRATTVLTKIEEQLLGFLIINPEYVQKFKEAGLDYCIEAESGRTIVRHLGTVSQAGSSKGPEYILELASGPERSFISKCLIDFPEMSDEQREEEAAEKIFWLKENSIKSAMRQLTAQIKQAQQDNNNDLLMQLMVKKNKIREG
jgi:hypothetical protein